MKRKPFPNSTFNTESLSPTRLFEREFIGTPGSSRSHHVYDTCACCEKRDCEALEEYNKTIKKLEGDTRLAAEIGQSLLIKHEDYVTESSQRTAKLTQQLEECNQKIRALEQSLDQAETSKEELMAEKKQWLRERCQQLTGELQSKNNELEKLRVFKFMVRQSEAREETLSTKLEDTYQELAICRKNELLLESKIKKLKMKYGRTLLLFFF
ncbi:hypothetical protein BY458DRAFT_567113 [Sporodiniella umbellata]|nr:hypothetical protein BY458DRAFT_567113 [Sporodiniella umbellata]